MIIFIILSLLLFQFSGCYDSKEIDTKAFVLAVGIDTIEGKESGQKETETIKGVPDRFTVTFELPLFSQQLAAGETEKFWMLSTRGASIIEAIRNSDLRSDRVLTFGHLKVVAISEEMARKGLFPILDFFHREPVVPRKTNIIITEGKAGDAISIIPYQEQLYGIYQEDLLESERSSLPRTAHQLRQTFINLNKMLYGVKEKRNAFIPYVKKSKDNKETIISGLAIIKDGKMVGKLSNAESYALALLLNLTNDRVTIIAPSLIFPGCDLVFEAHDTHSQLKYLGDKENISFGYHVNVDGYFAECPSSLIKEETGKDIDAINKSVEKQLKQDIERTIKKMQVLNVDLLGLDSYLFQKHPKVWKQVAANWDELFPEADIDVQVTVHTRHLGTSK